MIKLLHLNEIADTEKLTGGNVPKFPRAQISQIWPLVVLVYATGSFELRVLTGLDIYGSFSGLSIDIYRWYRDLAI